MGLLKRKNEEEVAETWLTCQACGNGVHKVCSMYNEYVHSEKNYRCPICVIKCSDQNEGEVFGKRNEDECDYFTFVSGSETPVRLDTFAGRKRSKHNTAESLPETEVSRFIQRRVRDCIAKGSVPNSEKTVIVRMISDCDKIFKVPGVIRKHFRQPSREHAS